MMEIKVINNLNDDVKEKLKDFGKDDSKLNSLNPYGLENPDKKDPYPKLDKIIEKFLKYYKGDGKGVFSWVEELNELEKDLEGENISYNGDSANQHYCLPTHVNGDYKNGLIYHCLFNAGTNGVEDSLKISENSLYDYYKIPEKELGKGPKDINDIISESEEEKIVENLRHNIIGFKSILTKEIMKKRKEGEKYQAYYCDKYYQEIIEKNKNFYFDSDENEDDIAKLTNKLVNIELYPLSSKNKSGSGYKLNKFSLFGAYIILYRIGKYLNDVETNPNIQKPRFIFRSFTDWTACIRAAIKNRFDFDDDTIDDMFEYLYDNFFLEFSSPNAGSVSSINVVKKLRIGNERFDKMTDFLSDPEN